jgi:sugar lactone lactonase YvrE
MATSLGTAQILEPLAGIEYAGALRGYTMPTQASVLVAFDNEEDKFLPEGPRAVTLSGRPALAWVNIQTAPDATRGAVHVRFWDTGERRRYATPARPGFLLPTDAPETLFLGMEKAVGTLNLATGLWSPLATIPDANPRTIINDGEVVPGGRAVVFGTKDTKFAAAIAELYLFTLDDQRVTLLAGEQTCSNGKVFAGSSVLFDIDTPRKVVTRYQFDLQNRKVDSGQIAVDLRSDEAFPDGMRDGGDGSAIVAFYNPHRGGAGKAVRYRLDTGAAIEEWATHGSPRVTCPLLVERDRAVKLLLTTATEGMSAELRKDAPNAGSLFIADTTVRMMPAAERVRL